MPEIVSCHRAAKFPEHLLPRMGRVRLFCAASCSLQPLSCPISSCRYGALFENLSKSSAEISSTSSVTPPANFSLAPLMPFLLKSSTICFTTGTKLAAVVIPVLIKVTHIVMEAGSNDRVVLGPHWSTPVVSPSSFLSAPNIAGSVFTGISISKDCSGLLILRSVKFRMPPLWLVTNNLGSLLIASWPRSRMGPGRRSAPCKRADERGPQSHPELIGYEMFA